MAYEFRAKRMVEFSDTDMAGIMHFSNFFRFMETAEHGFYRSLGFSVDMEKALGLGWPRVKAECEYKYPLRFEDVVEIQLLVRKIGTRSMTLDFHFSKTEHGKQIEAATGRLTIVCVERDPVTGKMKSAPIPDEIRARIQVAPPDVLASGSAA
jgi:YbgC/YbaW family acyl-CoA thioester hydrolase